MIIDVEYVVARLHDPRYTVQFVGPKGCGKTTHLSGVRDKFSKMSECVADGQNSWSESCIGRRCCILLEVSVAPGLLDSGKPCRQSPHEAPVT